MTAPALEHVARPDGPVLVLEASSSEGSVAIVHGTRCLASLDVAMGAGREDQLFPASVALLARSGLTVGQLSGVVCGAGPGSFTSLRIAASIAKGMAHGADRPLFAVSSLLLAGADAVSDAAGVSAGRYLVHSDALRGERYAQVVVIDEPGLVGAASPAHRVVIAQLDALASSEGVRQTLSVGAIEFAETRRVTPRAAGLCRVAPENWAIPVALDAWEPAYGRLAEAQVKWEATHGATLASATKA